MSQEPRRPELPLPSVTALAPPAGFAQALSAIDVTLSPEIIARQGDFLARLLSMNEQLNLTSITDPAEAWSRHVFDSLTLLPLLTQVPAGARVLDVGSGGGVPGIPLAIARPDLEFTLLDATEKKVAFLSAVSRALELPLVTAVAGRAEKLAATDWAKSFDVVTARAVAKISGLLAWTAPFVKPGGRMLFIKGQRADEELADARHVLRRYGCTHDRTLPTPTGRVVVLRVG